jgi:hypothetical protein
MCGQDDCCEGQCCCGKDTCDCGRRGFRRRYQTRAERATELEAYLAELKNEVQAVEEQLAELRP